MYASAAALAVAIRTREIACEEVVEAHLERIAAVNPKLNALVQLTAGTARAEAWQADQELAAGKLRGPLHGVPFTIKDSIETAGVICTSGTQGRASLVPKQDATAVERLRAAGGILLGKTNLPDLLFAFESDNLVYGRTNNPYDLARTSGGSSGGEAAIIAAGGSPLGVGSDAAGSVRLPAHFCGIAGLKPTSGRLARSGHYPPPGGMFDSAWQIGPMARFVDDLALVMPILAGIDWRDASVVPMPLGGPATVDLKALRIAFYTDNGIVPATPETARVVRTAARATGRRRSTARREAARRN